MSNLVHLELGISDRYQKMSIINQNWHRESVIFWNQLIPIYNATLNWTQNNFDVVIFKMILQFGLLTSVLSYRQILSSNHSVISSNHSARPTSIKKCSLNTRSVSSGTPQIWSFLLLWNWFMYRLERCTGRYKSLCCTVLKLSVLLRSLVCYV